LHGLADQIAEALAPVRGYPLALFGHSMGAMVAYEVALRIERCWGIAPSRLFVSGSDAPAGQPLESPVGERDDNELVTLLRGWGLIDPAVLAQPGLREMALSALRADLRLLRTYRATPAVGLTCPVTAVVGDDDPEVSVPQVLDWTRFTQGEFDFRVLTGDHFYLVPRQEELIMEVQHRLGVHAGVTARWSTP
jgi:pyochelin biosynthetic protein PchC